MFKISTGEYSRARAAETFYYDDDDDDGLFAWTLANWSWGSVLLAMTAILFETIASASSKSTMNRSANWKGTKTFGTVRG